MSRSSRESPSPPSSPPPPPVRDVEARGELNIGPSCCGSPANTTCEGVRMCVCDVCVCVCEGVCAMCV